MTSVTTTYDDRTMTVESEMKRLGQIKDPAVRAQRVQDELMPMIDGLRQAALDMRAVAIHELWESGVAYRDIVRRFKDSTGRNRFSKALVQQMVERARQVLGEARR